MKDYILENRDLIGLREILQLSMETANNRIETVSYTHLDVYKRQIYGLLFLIPNTQNQ